MSHGSTDAELLALCGAADRGAADAFVRRHQAGVWRYARAVAVDREAAEDVLQETFLAALRGASTFRGGSARGWLLTIARHASHRQHRRRVGAPREHEPLDALGLAAGWGEEDSPEALAIDHERRDQLEAALDRLGVDDREVLVLRDLEGLSGEETAALLGLPLATTKTRLHRARLRLMAALRVGGTDG